MIRSMRPGAACPDSRPSLRRNSQTARSASASVRIAISSIRHSCRRRGTGGSIRPRPTERSVRGPWPSGLPLTKVPPSSRHPWRCISHGRRPASRSRWCPGAPTRWPVSSRAGSPSRSTPTAIFRTTSTRAASIKRAIPAFCDRAPGSVSARGKREHRSGGPRRLRRAVMIFPDGRGTLVDDVMSWLAQAPDGDA